jgi:hypothetical protein
MPHLSIHTLPWLKQGIKTAVLRGGGIKRAFEAAGRSKAPGTVEF